MPAPLVSCLMVTSAQQVRAGLIEASISAYCAQSYTPRELVIVIDRDAGGDAAALLDRIRLLARNDIRAVVGETALSLGALRNMSRREARGALLCQWDDDDLHHPERIAVQERALRETRSEAVCLQEAMHFFPKTKTLYCTNWRATEAAGLPGTILWRADCRITYPQTGPAARLGEDTDFACQFRARGGLHALAGFPHLYIYVHHGANSWSDSHHHMLAGKLGISRALLRRRETHLREGLAAFDFGAEEIIIAGYNGAAFTLRSGSAEAGERVAQTRSE